MIITLRDYIFLIFEIPLSFFLIILWRKSAKKDEQRIFQIGLLVKLFACFMLGIIYQYYFDGAGDTLNYFKHSKFLTNAIVDSPSNFFEYLFSTEDDFKRIFSEYIYNQTEAEYYFNLSNITMVKITAICNFFSFNSFFGSGFIFSFFSFYGLWKIYTLFNKAYPEIGKQFLIIFFIPSVIFWSSGILKDAFCMGAVGIIIYQFDKLKVIEFKILFRLLLILALSYLIFLIKPYVIFCLIVPLLFWKYCNLMIKFKKFLPAKLLILGSLIGFLLIIKLAHVKELIQNISLEELYLLVLKTRAGFESATDGGGSFFSLGDFSPTMAGFASQIPSAINVVLFRPYLWETRKLFPLIASIEGLAILGATIYVFYKSGFKQNFKNLFTNPDIFFCFFFSILFSAALGMNVTNFGSLVRFKILFLPFYFIGLILLYYKKGERTKYISADSFKII